MISIRQLHYYAGAHHIIRNISAEMQPGKFNMILGPNGSGKSTLLKLFSGGLQSSSGEIFYDDKKLTAIKQEDIAKRRAVLSQQNELSFPLSVFEVIMMGRYPHFNFSPAAEDEKMVEEVIELLDLKNFSGRNYLTLSGGEKQRVQFARALAQIRNSPDHEMSYLFMDEPLAGLDINYQQEFLQLSKSLLKKNLMLVAVMHDINLAAQYGDHLIFLKDGMLIAEGEPKKILTPDLITKVFGVSSVFIDHPVTGLPLMIYDK